MTEPTYPSRPGPESPVFRRPWFVVLGGLVAVALVGALVGHNTEEPSSSVTASSSSSSAVRSEAVEPQTTSAVPPLPTSSAPAPASTTALSTGANVDFTMPDVVGMDLQSAQNLVQTFGVFYSVSHDLRGSRSQLVDSNWMVCDQNIAPGQEVSGDVEGRIDFGVVKREEQCP